MFLQGLAVALTVVSGVIGILLEKPPLRVKVLLVALALLGGLVAVANSYYDNQEATKKRIALEHQIKNESPPPN
jgi:hypothetical protein